MGVSNGIGGTIGALPPGVVMPYAGPSAPANWLLCGGQAVSRTDYGSLFAVIGTTYGSGDGSTTFNVPDLRGRVVAGVDNMGGTDAGRLDWANTLGTNGGAQTHTLTEAQIPRHTHVQNAHSHGPGNETRFVTNSGQLIAGLTAGNALYSPFNAATSTANATATNQNTGGGQAHNIMQPTMVMNYIIKASNY